MKAEEKEANVAITEKKDKPFSEEDLMQAWEGFKAQKADVADTDKLILNRRLTKGDENKVIIHLSSQLEVSFLEKMEMELIQALRSQLENDHITLERQIVQEEEKKKLYTSKDIFQHMVKENPALQNLKDRLGLDFDY